MAACTMNFNHQFGVVIGEVGCVISYTVANESKQPKVFFKAKLRVVVGLKKLCFKWRCLVVM